MQHNSTCTAMQELSKECLKNTLLEVKIVTTWTIWNCNMLRKGMIFLIFPLFVFVSLVFRFNYFSLFVKGLTLTTSPCRALCLQCGWRSALAGWPWHCTSGLLWLLWSSSTESSTRKQRNHSTAGFSSVWPYPSAKPKRTPSVFPCFW